MFSKAKFKQYQARNQVEKKHTIMIVDDEAPNLRTLGSLLANKYKLIEASDGQDALEQLEAMENPEQIGLIISDQRMPRLTGSELFAKVLPMAPKTQRIILTGHAGQTTEDTFAKVSLFELVHKPFDQSDLMNTVERALQTYDDLGPNPGTTRAT